MPLDWAGPGNSNAIALEAYANARAGEQDTARAAFDHLLHVSKDRYVPPYHMATIYAGLDEAHEAVAWLERGFEQRDPKMAFLHVEPRWQPLRNDPRFVSLLRRMKFVP